MFMFKVFHKHVSKCGCYTCAHGCSSDLEEVIVIKLEIVEFLDHFEEGEDGGV